MNNEEDKINRLVSAETKRLVTKIFKYNLMVLEDLRHQHVFAVNNLKNLSGQELESLNYLDFTRYSLLRKRILDNGNESIRDLENFLDNFAFTLKNNNSNNEITYKKKEKGL